MPAIVLFVIYCFRVTIKGRKVKVNIFDMGGEQFFYEVQHACLQYFRRVLTNNYNNLLIIGTERILQGDRWSIVSI